MPLPCDIARRFAREKSVGRALPPLLATPKSDVQNEVKARTWTEGGGAPTLPSHPADRASVALAAAVGGAAFGRTRSLAISQRGHGHHLLQQNLKEVRQLRARAQDLQL